MLVSYQSKKLVMAEPMTSTEWLLIRSQYSNYSDASLEADLEGYHVVYNHTKEEEYHSWSPKLVFEEGYDPCETMWSITGPMDSPSPYVVVYTNDLIDRIDALSAEDKCAVLSILADESVNMSNEAEHNLFAKILSGLGATNNLWVKPEFKLDELAGFSTYSVGYHGWLKEIYATNNNHSISSFIKLVDDTVNQFTK